MLSFLKKFRKAYLTRLLRIYYSQFGEDVVVRELIGKKKEGIYVDVGCYHPIKFSNTYWLYRRGWRGVNVDMEEHKIELFKVARSKDHNVLAAVSDLSQKLYVKNIKRNDLGAHLESEGSESEAIVTRSLNEILSESPYAQRKIDLLSIDAESHDFNVLKSIDLSIYQPDYILIEAHGNDIRKFLDSEINRYLESYKYRLRSWVVSTMIFTNSLTLTR
ncbi:MAG: FkbM family methyltransferase [Verrucomicrobiota bacterium]